ncbi:MAG: Uma2 family endonuclease [Synechococcales cyanobacterium CRU_2_2]|nr:Uma2 family endonuclease [Synechococcales cyanobacterium CRU_2_2]
MIASPQFHVTMTPEEYLAWEAEQELRHEYDNGAITAMTGGTLPHNDLAINLLSVLRPHVKARGCRINLADAKVKVRDDGPYYYPDLVVSCDSRDRASTQLIRYPTLIVEVLSPSTESRDRGKKFRQLQESETLQEYVLIDYASVQVECFRRSEGRFWVYETFGAGDVVRLAAVEFECAIETLYEDVNLTASPDA